MNSIIKHIVHLPAEEYHTVSRSGQYMSSHLSANFC